MFPSSYFAATYFADKYWPELPSTSISAPLLNAGYWPETYFARGMWIPRYWPVHGAATAGSPGREDYQRAWEQRHKRGKHNARIHRDDQDMMELLLMFTGQWEC